MAEGADDSERTEEPTAKKLEDARKKGDVAKSQEVNTWFVMIGATLIVALFSGDMAGDMTRLLGAFLERPHEFPMDGEHLRHMLWRIGQGLLLCTALPLLVLVLAAIGGNLVQNLPVISAENMKPKLSKISLISGAKRLFGPKSLVNFAKGLAKLTIVGVVAFLIIWPERDRLDTLISYDPGALLPLVRELSLKMLAGVLAVLTVIAVADYVFERSQWLKKQRMTPQEVKDEWKQMEGDPTVKAKLRQVRIERGKKRMMAEVPNASVVITNPTHYAVALKYEPGMTAPECVAKGLDALALKIREVAEEHDVPIVENPPLARALHASVAIDDKIPPEHYKAVAEVIGYVMRLRGKMKRRVTRRR